jgi:hypothetical protein
MVEEKRVHMLGFTAYRRGRQIIFIVDSQLEDRKFMAGVI